MGVIMYNGIQYTGAGGGDDVEDVYVNGASVLDSNKIAQVKSYMELTESQYNALPASKLSDDILYCISDIDYDDRNYFNPIIYSTTEREVGVWTDGKPLYQKTINCGALPNNTDKRIQHGIQNVDYFVGVFGIAENPNINSIPIIFSNSNGSGIATIILEKSSDIIIRCNSDRSTYTKTFITLQYTKTTDVAGSGRYNTLGVPAVHYTTDEQIIGTWIDGKPLYQKTYIYNFSGTAQSTYILDNNIKSDSGIYRVTKIEGVWQIGAFGYSTATLQNINHSGSFSLGNQTVTVNVQPNGLTLTRSDTSYGIQCAVTIQYTKTTD